MEALKSFMANLHQLQKPLSLAPTAADSYFAAGLQWFKEKQALYAAKKSAYTTAKEEHDNKTDTCNAAQTSYESDYCQWVGQGTAATKSYTRCWKQGGGDDWEHTRAAVLDSAEQRKHEYVAVKKIHCFLSSILVRFSKAGKVTKQNISACKALAPDTSIFDLVNTNAPPKKSLASLGNLTSMPGNGVWQKSEYASLSDVKAVTPCAKALDEDGTLIWKDGNVTHLCNANEHVLVHRCEPCAPGKSRPEGDNAVGPDTECSAIICSADERVQSNRCLACLAGMTRIAGDDASKADTSCTAILCDANQRVTSNTCDNCPAGTSNAAGDDASGGNRCHFVRGKSACPSSCLPCMLSRENKTSRRRRFGRQHHMQGDQVPSQSAREVQCLSHMRCWEDQRSRRRCLTRRYALHCHQVLSQQEGRQQRVQGLPTG
eukprot:TRINITY_DN763_c1_g1_i2.p1 TRINITY_DN763_c1_g1~~TRINITY_DN763_c1_g1_i2.p1  ORF type:complete len:431 (+),score=71.98 TRINITY_DN763_c1_g1_i2:624-1916(+)